MSSYLIRTWNHHFHLLAQITTYNVQQLHQFQKSKLRVRKIHQNSLPYTFSIPFLPARNSYICYCSAASIKMEDELPWFRVVTEKVSDIRWTTPSLLHQDEIQAHHQFILSIFFHAARRI